MAKDWKYVVAGVPFCVNCLDAMKIVRNDVLIVCRGGRMRRAYKGDLYECKHCGHKVVDPAKGIDIEEPEVLRRAAEGDDVILMEGA